MATKIDNPSPIPSAPGPGSSRSIGRAASDAASETASGAPASGDSLQLSGEAAGMIAAQRGISSAAPSMDEAKIAALRAAVSSGSYQINPQEIASRLIALERKLA